MDAITATKIKFRLPVSSESFKCPGGCDALGGGGGGRLGGGVSCVGGFGGRGGGLGREDAPGRASAAEAVVAALACDRDNYMALVAGQNGLDMETLRRIMKQSYGWSK